MLLLLNGPWGNKRILSKRETVDLEREREKWSTLEDFSGRRMPAVVLDGGTIFSTRTLLSVGISRFAISLFRNTIQYNKIKLIRVLVSTLNIQQADPGFVLSVLKQKWLQDCGGKF